MGQGRSYPAALKDQVTYWQNWTTSARHEVGVAGL